MGQRGETILRDISETGYGMIGNVGLSERGRYGKKISTVLSKWTLKC